jgi:glutamine amidotransferase
LNIVLIDYGAGNLHSAAKAFERALSEGGLSGRVVVSSSAADVRRADRIVLPGDGAFADCMANLQAAPGMIEALEQRVRREATPFLGICVGMQLLASEGLEHGVTPGLDWLPGQVTRIEPRNRQLKVPHMGWNTLTATGEHPLLTGLPLGDAGLHAYFLHAYHLVAANPSDVLARAEYGGPVTAIVTRDTIAGTQFHPEKSQRLGIALLINFLKWRP